MGLSIQRGSGGSSTLDINGLAAADLALADALPEYNASAAANKKITIAKLLGFAMIWRG